MQDRGLIFAGPPEVMKEMLPAPKYNTDIPLKFWYMTSKKINAKINNILLAGEDYDLSLDDASPLRLSRPLLKYVYDGGAYIVGMPGPLFEHGDVVGIILINKFGQYSFEKTVVPEEIVKTVVQHPTLPCVDFSYNGNFYYVVKYRVTSAVFQPVSNSFSYKTELDPRGNMKRALCESAIKEASTVSTQEQNLIMISPVETLAEDNTADVLYKGKTFSFVQEKRSLINEKIQKTSWNAGIGMYQYYLQSNDQSQQVPVLNPIPETLLSYALRNGLQDIQLQHDPPKFKVGDKVMKERIEYYVLNVDYDEATTLYEYTIQKVNKKEPYETEKTFNGDALTLIREKQ